MSDHDWSLPHIAAHRSSSGHRAHVLSSELCGCFYCLSTFPPSTITKWIDNIDGVATTALCPHCGIDSVIGAASGYPITRAFLKRMHDYWFSVPE
jgi:hypothetical protein